MNAEPPLVSIVISNYNYARYLSESIDSAINQTYPNTEIIVVDDGSQDNSRDVIASYKDKIVPICKTNGGQASAFNTGFAISQGEIICFLDADDIWLPEKVEKTVEAFSIYSKAVVAYHKVQNIDEAGTTTGKPWPFYKPIRGNISSQVAQTGGWWPFPPSTALSYRRNFLGKVMNVPEEEFRICADTYLADLAPFFGEVVGVDSVLSYYRIHSSNNWTNTSDCQDNAWAVRELQYHEIRANILNCTLKRLGIDLEVNLVQHWPYQLLKYKLRKQEESLIDLSLLALRNPWEHRLISKLKTVVLLWLKGDKGL